MGLVTPQQSNPGDTIEASDINTPVNQLAAVLNGNVDSTNLASSAVATANIAANAVTGAKIASYSTNRRNNSSNTTETAALIQTGWACGQPGVNASISFTVTFPIAFTNVPIVNATFGGDTSATTSTLGSGGGNVKQATAEAFGLTTTGFTLVIISRDGTNWGTGNTVYAHWTAIGT